jgi:hypothetical protein
MSYPSMRLRRQRRRRTLIIILIVLIAVGAAYGITRVQSDEVIRREYLDQARDIVSDEDSTANRFASLIVGLEDLRRTTMVSTLEELELEASEHADTVATLEEPGPDLLKAHLFLQIAATRWRSGMASTRAGMIRLSESSLDDAGIALVTEGLTDLRVGDSAYAGFLGAISDIDTSLQGGSFPRVAFIPEEDRELFDPTEVARRLFLTPQLGLTTNMALADISLDPAPLGEQDGLPVIPSGSGLNASVAVANRGNSDTEGTLVRLILVSSDGETFEDDRLVGELSAGEVTSLVFEDLPVAAGTIYEITARIETVDDDPLDDVTTFVFVMDEET